MRFSKVSFTHIIERIWLAVMYFGLFFNTFLLFNHVTDFDYIFATEVTKHSAEEITSLKVKITGWRKNFNKEFPNFCCWTNIRGGGAILKNVSLAVLLAGIGIF